MSSIDSFFDYLINIFPRLIIILLIIFLFGYFFGLKPSR